MTAQSLAVLAATPADYHRIGVTHTIAPWEDGARTDNSPGTYEWWYFDAHLDNGAILVIVFQNKDFADPDQPLDPIIRVDLTLPDGRAINRLVHFEPSQWQAAEEHADVRIGERNRFAGDLKTYTISVDLEGITDEVILTSEVPAWRPETGVMLFGENRDLEFSWLPSVPQGRVQARYTVDGVTAETSGVGYHDHNWGNVGPAKIINDWYWARGQAGPFSVITSFITATKKYQYDTIPIFMIAKDGVLVADDSTKVTFERENIHTDDHTGKPVADITRYTHTDGDDRYVVTFTRSKTIANGRMIDRMHGSKRLLARLVRFDGAYLRFAGDVHIQHFKANQLVDEARDNGIWELMYFGRTR